MSDFSTTSHRKAVKQHRCFECGRTIDAGENYWVTAGSWDGSFSTVKTCAHCDIFRKVLGSRDQYFFDEIYYGGLSEYDWGDLRTPALDELDYLMLLRLRARYGKQWSNTAGVIPIPYVKKCEQRGQWGYDDGPNGEPAQGKSWVKWDWYDSLGVLVPGESRTRRYGS